MTMVDVPSWAPPPPPASSAASSSTTSPPWPDGVRMIRKKSGELVKPSLKTASGSSVRGRHRRPKSMPTTPTADLEGGFLQHDDDDDSAAFITKNVHFSTQLEHIRHFLHNDRPEAVSTQPSPVDSPGDGAGGGLAMPPPAAPSDRMGVKLALPNFTPEARPGDASGYAPVRLETLYLSPDRSHLMGRIAVANIAYEKDVRVRYSPDDWRTSMEVRAYFAAPYTSFVRVHHGTAPLDDALDTRDRFTFSILLPDFGLMSAAQISALRYYLCLSYSSAGQTFWDNNHGENYQIRFTPRPSSISVGLGDHIRQLPRRRSSKDSMPADSTTAEPRPYFLFSDQNVLTRTASAESLTLPTTAQSSAAASKAPTSSFDDVDRSIRGELLADRGRIGNDMSAWSRYAATRFADASGGRPPRLASGSDVIDDDDEGARQDENLPGTKGALAGGKLSSSPMILISSPTHSFNSKPLSHRYSFASSLSAALADVRSRQQEPALGSGDVRGRQQQNASPAWSTSELESNVTGLGPSMAPVGRPAFDSEQYRRMIHQWCFAGGSNTEGGSRDSSAGESRRSSASSANGGDDSSNGVSSGSIFNASNVARAATQKTESSYPSSGKSAGTVYTEGLFANPDTKSGRVSSPDGSVHPTRYSAGGQAGTQTNGLFKKLFSGDDQEGPAVLSPQSGSAPASPSDLVASSATKNRSTAARSGAANTLLYTSTAKDISKTVAPTSPSPASSSASTSASSSPSPPPSTANDSGPPSPFFGGRARFIKT